ncbi:MAG: signal peptidase II [Acidimicrobiales bacterium]
MRDAQDVDVLEADRPTVPASALRLAIAVALAVVLVDQITKRWALAALEPAPCSTPGACIDLVAGARFHLVFNTGAAFTRGSGYGPALAILAFVMAGALLYLSTRRTDRWGIVLFGAIAGGAIGNLIDRVFRASDGPLSGAVVDFIDLGWWPVFNIADSAIVVGVVAIIVMSFFEVRADDDSAGGDPESAGDGDSESADDGDPESADDRGSGSADGGASQSATGLDSTVGDRVE